MDFSEKKRVVVKIGSNSLTHPVTGHVDYIKIERLVRELCDLKNRGMDVCLVTSGAIAVGRQSIGYKERPKTKAEKQALASVGQARLMSIYQRYFSEYTQSAGQILMTKNTMLDGEARKNAERTFEQLFSMGVIPVVNENDTLSTYEMQFGDNDTLSAIVCTLIKADLLILLSDIDGLFTADPKVDPEAKLVDYVEEIDEELESMAGNEPGSDVGTGGMATKIRAAKIASKAGAEMIIANGRDVSVLHKIFEGDFTGTVFQANYDDDFYVVDFLKELY
ncbi:MAG: glutamate 5-kinase [Lachnospiraceae bacterium]|jgi:glutamate 5-kinase|nr:glutamate 5-kinase [Lachnospiraceae bacterium]SEI40957.1 glutamate 5-kinase [Lachnospiraceae bacterium A10]